MSSVYLEHRDAYHVAGAKTKEEVEAAVLRAAEALASCDALLFTAGAGMGVDSGLPDFRGSTGLFKDRGLAMTYEEMSDDKWFTEDPAFAWGVNYTQLEMYRQTPPHAGYNTLLKWAGLLGKPYYVFTSNIDGMFEQAGFLEEKVVTCHGDMHHLQCTHDRRTCKGFAEDRSDEVWLADGIPSGLGSRIDAGALRFEDVSVLDEPYFRCPRCKSLARPNVWFCHDKNYVPREFSIARRSAFNTWLSGLQDQKARLVVIECGGGMAIPSVRVEGEDAVEGCGEGSLLVRLNPTDCKVPAEKAVGIPMGAMAGLARIDAALTALRGGRAAPQPKAPDPARARAAASGRGRSPRAKSKGRSASPARSTRRASP